MGEDNEDTNVRVAVRCRPMNSRETAMGTANCVQISATDLTITGPGGDDHSFRFDIILGEDSLQTQLWDHIGTPILEKAFSGYNGTIFAYGQTGSGKTWSMQGGKDDMEGVIPRMNNAIFDRIACQKAQTPTLHFLVTVSYFELHNEVIFDLLDVNDRKTKRAGLEIKEHPVLGNTLYFIIYDHYLAIV
jgi:kinesin family protein 1/kinesin family protein 3/17